MRTRESRTSWRCSGERSAVVLPPVAALVKDSKVLRDSETPSTVATASAEGSGLSAGFSASLPACWQAAKAARLASAMNLEIFMLVSQ